MSRKRRSITGPPKALPCFSAGDCQDRADAIVQTTLRSVGLRSDERVLVVGTDLEALEIMCSLMRRGVPHVAIVRDRWPVTPHSITLIIVPSLALGTQILQAIEMAPRVLAACGRLIFWLLAGQGRELSKRIESTLCRSGFDLTQEKTAVGDLLCAVFGLQMAARSHFRPDPASRSRSGAYSVDEWSLR
jgi:hypothetical protein